MTIQFSPRHPTNGGYPWNFIYFHGDAEAEVARRFRSCDFAYDLVLANVPRPVLTPGRSHISRGMLFDKNVTAYLWMDEHGQYHGLVCYDTDRGSCEYAERKMNELVIAV